MKHLLVISNHAPEKWSEKQKQGWDKIEFYPFPNVPANATSREVFDEFAIPICHKIDEFYTNCDKEGAEGYVTIQGEFSLCKAVFDTLYDKDIRFVFPTTERRVVETQNPDGTTTKTALFEFVQWRKM